MALQKFLQWLTVAVRNVSGVPSVCVSCPRETRWRWCTLISNCWNELRLPYLLSSTLSCCTHGWSWMNDRFFVFFENVNVLIVMDVREKGTRRSKHSHERALVCSSLARSWCLLPVHVTKQEASSRHLSALGKAQDAVAGLPTAWRNAINLNSLDYKVRFRFFFISLVSVVPPTIQQNCSVSRVTFTFFHSEGGFIFLKYMHAAGECGLAHVNKNWTQLSKRETKNWSQTPQGGIKWLS